MNAPDYLNSQHLRTLVDLAFAEDLGEGGDVTTQSTIPESTQATATFLLKADGVVAGLEVADYVFATLDAGLTTEWSARDGQALLSGTVVGTVSGPARSLLVAERTVLNLMQRMSGIATETARYVAAVEGTGVRVLDTRKTAPGLRGLDKWAVALGGGTNHRIGLHDRILIKDNHIAASGGIAQAIHAAAKWRDANAPGIQIECEARTLREVRLAAATGLLDYLLLDNFARVEGGALNVAPLEAALAEVQAHDPDAGTEQRIQTEASGGVTLGTVGAIARTGVDFVSVGALTHSVTALDLSLKIDLEV
jgi:nicotinate-nucleotide pyrophosphorylase (carboxylating)